MIPADKVLSALDCFSSENADKPMTVSDCKARCCPFQGTDCELAVLDEAAKVIRKQRRKLKSMRYRLYGRR